MTGTSYDCGSDPGIRRFAIDIVLPDLAAVDLRLLDVLLDAERRLSARDGHLSVRTRDGFWDSGVQGMRAGG